MSFRLTGLYPAPFRPLYGLSDADLADGAVLEPLIARFLADPRVAYLHAHYARRGCYAARIERG